VMVRTRGQAHSEGGSQRLANGMKAVRNGCVGRRWGGRGEMLRSDVAFGGREGRIRCRRPLLQVHLGREENYLGGLVHLRGVPL
jgi:hypothetical protein